MKKMSILLLSLFLMSTQAFAGFLGNIVRGAGEVAGDVVEGATEITGDVVEGVGEVVPPLEPITDATGEVVKGTGRVVGGTTRAVTGGDYYRNGNDVIEEDVE